MADDKIKKQICLRVLTPMRVVYDRQADLVIARTCDGDIGIMAGHDRCMALLVDGVLRVYTDLAEKQSDVFLVLGGVLSVENDVAVISSYMAAPPNQLQALMAQIDAERAANVVNEKAEDLSIQRMENAMRHALVSMDVSAYSILKSHGNQEQDQEN
ncbi:MAG: F0F1 ATP synthase subunit epsilon [Defluviitaleaceae bacterium]|nr:F0F1 ATP synthase subunit epsilon [Defluviitaleaceae bacterium]